MWRNNPWQDNLQRTGSKLTLPALTNSNSLSLSRYQPQRDKSLKLDKHYFSLQGYNFSQVPLAVHNTMAHLTSRHMEISHWQTQINECIRRVEIEIACVEQLKEMAERCLRERQLYSQLLRDCVALCSSLDSAGMRKNQVFSKLKIEEHQINEGREVLQRQIFILLDKLSSLKTIHSELLRDSQDKTETMKLTTRCLTFKMDTPCTYLPNGPFKPVHVSYEWWLSHCRKLKLKADDLVKVSSSFRGKLQFLIANLNNSSQCQRCSTGESFRRKIHKLTRTNNTLNMERQRIKDEISDLNKDVQGVAYQIQNCESRLHQTIHLLNTLNQRPRFELCMDLPHNNLSLDKEALAAMVAGLQSMMQHYQQNLSEAHRRLTAIEDKLARNAQNLELAQRGHSLHQSFRLVLDTAVGMFNKPRLCGAVDGCGHQQ